MQFPALSKKLTLPTIRWWHLGIGSVAGLMVAVILTTSAIALRAQQVYLSTMQTVRQMQKDRQSLEATLMSTQQELASLSSTDQVKRNDELTRIQKEVHDTYLLSIAQYENLIDLKEGKGKSSPLDKLYAAIVQDLATSNPASATANLVKLKIEIAREQAKLSTQSAGIVVTSVPISSTPPGSGYSRQRVQTDSGEFIVDIIAGDLNTTRVIVDTASDSTCTNNCPVLPLATYATRSGAYAGINGSYFCPESYPSCAGKTNSFDTLLMNKNKVYFNSDNNVYSQVPLAVFSGSSARFLSKSQDWGRDTGIDSAIANQPLLLLNGQVQFGGDGDPKKGSVGSRSFLGSKGSTAYIGVVRGATVAQAARVVAALGLDHAINLDSGGSTALWVNGSYKAGPGRALPNAILFVKK